MKRKTLKANEIAASSPLDDLSLTIGEKIAGYEG